MFGEGNGPVGTENPMEFLRPFMSDVAGMRRRIAAALDTLTREADRRAIGDIKAAVLAVHGAADPVAPKAERDAFETEMTEAGACWALLTFGDVCHAFTDPQANTTGVAVYDEPATRHGYALAHAFIADAFVDRRHGCPPPRSA